MQAILGKITQIHRQDDGATGRRGDGAKQQDQPFSPTRPLAHSPTRPVSSSWEVRFQAACVLPQRARAPEWLKEQTLAITRDVRDARELGRPGDSIILTPAESERWLYPLTVTPGVAYGELPETLELRLRWWKEEKLPEYTVHANGRRQSGSFTKDGDGATASVEVRPLFPMRPSLPVTVEVTCDKMTVACTVLPAAEPGYGRLLLPEGERHRLENEWYVIEISGQSHGGGIASLREKGRGVEHFSVPADRVQAPFQNGGHTDQFRTGWDWSEQMAEARMTCAGTRREADATRLRLEGVVDEGKGLRTSVVYTLFDRLPLLCLEREFSLQKGKEKEGEAKEKEEKPKEPIDEMQPLSLGFRAAWRAERDGCGGSRVLCADGDRLAAVRCAEVNEWVDFGHWRLKDGWVVVEHPRRREYTLYLFDRQTAPQLEAGLGPEAILLKPMWPFVPVRPQQSVGYSLALAAGELCGAGTGGAWVACRAPTAEGGVRCAVVSRLRDPARDASASFTLAGESREAPLQSVLIPGVGAVGYAAAVFPAGRMEDDFDSTVAGIAGRRPL